MSKRAIGRRGPRMLSRRRFLAGMGAGGALLALDPMRVLAQPLGTIAGPGAERASRLHPGLWLAHADLHNHTHLSDGDGRPELAFPSMRAHGLDVASLTDHSTLSWGAFSLADICGEPFFPPAEHGSSHDCRSVAGLTEEGWEITDRLAEELNMDGEFVAIRGFEWSSPFQGHINVWFSQRWIDPLHTAGIGPEGIGAEAHAFPELGPEVLQPLLDAATRDNPLAGVGMEAFYRWLTLDPSTPVVGGGSDGIASFNHPGREVGRFGYFSYSQEVAEQFVALEMMNRREDYLFKEFRKGQHSPLVECLNQGWRVALTGVTDEHGTNWGEYQGKGRTGLWLREDLGLTRPGVREAMEARRAFATREAGLRLDATANGAQMGNGIPHQEGPVEFSIDLDLGPALAGMPVAIQVLRPDEAFPKLVHIEHARAGGPGTPPITFEVPLSRTDGEWVVLRIADPSRPNDSPGPQGHPANDFALAYASPFWLEGGGSQAAAPAGADTTGDPAPTQSAPAGSESGTVEVSGDAVAAPSGGPQNIGSLPVTGGGMAALGAALAAASLAVRRALGGQEEDPI